MVCAGVQQKLARTHARAQVCCRAEGTSIYIRQSAAERFLEEGWRVSAAATAAVAATAPVAAVAAAAAATALGVGAHSALLANHVFSASKGNGHGASQGL